VNRAILALAVLTLSLAMPAAAGTKTTVIVFSPWNHGALTSGLVVAERVKGTCWTSSLSTDRKDAWRCMTAQSNIYDPCFSTASDRSLVACTDNPFSKHVALITLKEPLKSENNPYTKMLQPSKEPWALRLTTGETCSFETGATDTINEMPLNYQCPGGIWIVGFPDRSTALWHAHKSVFPKNRKLTTVAVAVAVF